MQLCWGPPESRPSISKIQVLLSHLQQNKETPPSQAFEERWHTLQQQSFSPRQHNLQYMSAAPESPPFVFDTHFNPKSASLQNLRGSLEDIVLKQEQEEEEEDKVQHQITLAIQELDDYLASEVTSSEISSDTATPEQKELVEWNPLKTGEEGSDGDSAILCSSLMPAELSLERELEDSTIPDVSGQCPKLTAKDLEYVSSRDVSSPPSPPPSPSMRCVGNFGGFSSGSTNSDVRHTVAFAPAHTMTLLDTPPVTPDAFSSCPSSCNSRYPRSDELGLRCAQPAEIPQLSTSSAGEHSQTSKENVQNSGETCEFLNDDAQNFEHEAHVLGAVCDKTVEMDNTEPADVRLDVDFKTFTSSDKSVDSGVDPDQFRVEMKRDVGYVKGLNLEADGSSEKSPIDSNCLIDHNLHSTFEEGVSSLSSSPVSLPVNISTSDLPGDQEKPFDSILNLCRSHQPVCQPNDLVNNEDLDDLIGTQMSTKFDNELAQNEMTEVLQNFNAKEDDDFYVSNAGPNNECSNDQNAGTNNFAYIDEIVSEMVNYLIASSIRTACALLSINNSVRSINSDSLDNVCTEFVQGDCSKDISKVPSDTVSQYYDGVVVDDQANVNDYYSVPKENGYCFVNNMLVSFPPYDECQGDDFGGSDNTMTCHAVPHFNGDMDILDQLTAKVMNCDKSAQHEELNANQLFVDSKYCPENQYEIEDILSGLENGEIDLDKDYSPASGGSGRKSAEDCTLFLEDLETGNREPIRCCGDNEELLDDELLIVNVETNEAMMLDPILRTYHEEQLYDDFHHIECYHPPRLESIMEESDDASHTYNDNSQMSEHYYQTSPGNVVHSVPPELVFEGDEIMAGEADDTDDDDDNSFQSDELEDEEEDEEDADDGEEANEEFHFKIASPFSDSRPDDAYTPDFESDTDDTSSSTGTSRTSSSGSFHCPNVQSPVKIFSTAWDCSLTPTKSAIKSPEKNKVEDGAGSVVGEMKKSVSFHEEDPKVVFSYPPVESDEDSEGNDDVAAEEFTFQVDYNNYADWDFQWTEEEIPEEDLEEATEEDSSEVAPFCSTPQGHLGPINMMYSLCCEEMLDSLDSQASLSSNTESQSFRTSMPSLSVKIEPITDSTIFSNYQSCIDNQSDLLQPYVTADEFLDSSFQTVSDQVELESEINTQLEYQTTGEIGNADYSIDLTSLVPKTEFSPFCSVTLTDQNENFDTVHSNNPDLGLRPGLLENEEEDLKILGATSNNQIFGTEQGDGLDVTSVSTNDKVIEKEQVETLDERNLVDFEIDTPMASSYSVSSFLSDPVSATTDSEVESSSEDNGKQLENQTSLFNLKNASPRSTDIVTEANFPDNWNTVQDNASLDKTFNLNILACRDKDFSLDSLTTDKLPEEDCKRQDVNLNSQLNGVWRGNFDIQPHANLEKENKTEGLLNEDEENGSKKNGACGESQKNSVSVPPVPQNRYTDDILEAINPTLLYDTT